jgi:predicted nucleic acid-binding protein
VSAFVDTNVLVRHLTGDPAEMAARATAYLSSERELFLTDLVVAETVSVLESFYEAPRPEVAGAIRALLSLSSVICVDAALLLRGLEVYETDRLDFAEAYLVACAESTGINRVASFDKSIDRVGTIERIEPGRNLGDEG